MKSILNEKRFDFIKDNDKDFINAFSKEMLKFGYGCNNEIGDGFCWGKYMIIYKKIGAKYKKVAARIYIRENKIILRLFFNDITKHSNYINNAPNHIKNVFLGEFGDCKHCKNEKNTSCKFRKSYVIGNNQIVKCNGKTFWFFNPTVDRLSDYINLFKQFYPIKNTDRT